MSVEPKEPKGATDDKTLITSRRLLLAKQLYLHALDHCNKAGAINKMIAVHNFHNAIEIALRAIILHHEIGAEKRLDIAFEAMLNRIDKHPPFKDSDIKLPYRQQLRNLNQRRNLVQHDAVEPPSATMDDWRVFTRRFLEQTCQIYFGLEFESLSALDWIDDPTLRQLLKESLASMERGDFRKSLTLVKYAFERATDTILNFLPAESLSPPFHISHGLRKFRDFEEAFDTLEAQARNAAYLAALFSSGVNLVDYKRFQSCTPSIRVASGGGLIRWGAEESDEEDARWAHNFVVETIVHWQTVGLEPTVPDSDWHRSIVQRLLEDDFLGKPSSTK